MLPMRAAVVFAVLLACRAPDQTKRRADTSATTTSKAPSDSSVVSAASSGAAVESFNDLRVTFGGQPVKVAKALIKRIPVSGRFQLVLTDKTANCEELISSLWDSHKGEHKVLIDLGQNLATDGTLQSLVTYAYSPDVTIQPGSSVKIGGKADAGERVSVAIDLSGASDKSPLEVHGSFIAEGCGERLSANKDGEPKAKHASTATLTIAGKKLPIFSMVRHGSVADDRQAPDFVLSTGPKDCSTTTPWAEVVLERHHGFWHARGQWLPNGAQNNALPDDKTSQIKITAGKAGTSDDGPTVELKLDGSGTIGDYPIALDGTIEAIDCPGSRAF